MLVAEYDYDMDIEVQREEAFKEGLEEGREEGEYRITELYRKLITDNRIEDLKKSMSNAEYQKQLLKEYGL